MDVHPRVSLEQIREQILGLELSLPHYMLLDRLSYTKEITAWRQKVAKERSPAVLCELMLFMEAHLTSEALKGWHDSPMQKIWRRFCRGREATSLREVALALDHLECAIQWQHAKQEWRKWKVDTQLKPCTGCDRSCHPMQLKLVPSGERQCRYYCSSCLANSTNPGLMLRRSKRPVDDDEDDDDADEEEDDGKGE